MGRPTQLDSSGGWRADIDRFVSSPAVAVELRVLAERIVFRDALIAFWADGEG